MFLFSFVCFSFSLSRLNFVYTVLSKRKLQWFVDTKRVAGWNDARFPTIQGILRRGMTVQALREFILGQGFSMSMNTMEWDKIWTINKRVIDPVAPRFTAVTKDNQAVLELSNFGAESAPQVALVDLHPKNKAVGSKTITRSARVILEQDDAKLIKDGEEVCPFFSSQRATDRDRLLFHVLDLSEAPDACSRPPPASPILAFA